MPTLNPSLPGVYAHGVAGDGGVVAANGQTIAGPNAGGNPDMHGPDWFSPTEVLCKTYPPEKLVAVDWQTGAQHVLYAGQVSDFCGGGGRWAALCLDGVVRVGSRDGVEYEYRNQIAPIAFGPDGSFAFKEWHRDGLILDGEELVPPSVPVADVQVLRAGSVLYRIGRTIYPFNLTLGFDFGWVRGINIGTRYLIACQRYDRGVIAFYADNPTLGYDLGPGPCYRLDIGLLGGGRARAVWATVSRDHAEDLVVKDWSLAEPMVTFDSEAQPQPPLQSPDPEPPVSIPDDFAIVRAINDAHPHLLQKNDHDSVREFYWRAAWALHQRDPRWGMLSKSGGETGQEIDGAGRVAEDAVAYKDAVPVVDIIAGANNPGHKAAATWQVVEQRRESNKWVKPPQFGAVTPKPEEPKPEQPAEDLVARFITLSKRVDAAESNAVAAQSAALIAVAKAEAIERALERKVDALEARVKRLRLISDKDGEQISSGSTWGHAHATKFRLVLPD
jgi:hypothetical protein